MESNKITIHEPQPINLPGGRTEFVESNENFLGRIPKERWQAVVNAVKNAGEEQEVEIIMFFENGKKIRLIME
jgi:hypothetical protein